MQVWTSWPASAGHRDHTLPWPTPVPQDLMTSLQLGQVMVRVLALMITALGGVAPPTLVVQGHQGRCNTQRTSKSGPCRSGAVHMQSPLLLPAAPQCPRTVA